MPRHPGSSARLLLPRSRAVLAALALIALVAITDLVVGRTAVLIPLLVIGPLVAAGRTSPPEVARIAVVAVAVGAVLGVLDGIYSSTAEELTALLAVAGGGALAVALARTQERLAGSVRQHGAMLATERAARRRADLLARSGQLLESALDPATVLQEMTGLTVPDFADMAIVDLHAEDAQLRGAVVHAADPAVAEALAEQRRRSPLGTGGPHPVAIALREGRPALLPVLTDTDLQRIAASPEHLEMMRRLRYHSAIVLPLTARRRTAGVLSLIRFAGSPSFTEDDAELALDIARRGALAYDNARLFSDLGITESRLEAILANLGETVAALAPDGTLLFANQAAADMAGVDSPADLMTDDVWGIIGRYVVVDDEGRPAPVERRPLGAAMRGEMPEPMLVHALDPEGGDSRWFQLRAAPVHDEAGRLQLVVSVIEDVTAVKREEMRARLLANASKLLSSSLNVSATLDKAAWAAVPELADWARVDLVDERGELHAAATAHRNLDKLELLYEWRRDYPPSPQDHRGPWEVLRRGESIVWDGVQPSDIEAYARTPRHAELMRTIATRSLLIVPMRIGDRVIGTMQVATTDDSGRTLGRGDLELAEELAARAAIAVEHARVHAARAHIASTLQRFLLPPRLPSLPGLTIVSRFRAAAGVGGAELDVGGDFYDVFEGRDRWMVMMGDVTGKGPAAAALTSLARYTIRTAAMYERDPSAMLERLNTTLVADPERRQICTAVCVGLDVDGNERVRLDVVSAGHPLPLLVAADGSVRSIGSPGTLLGAFAQGHWSTESVTMAPGESLVLYTDGVTDTRGERDRFGTERLRALLETLGPSPTADLIAQRIDEELLAFGDQRDDVALLILRADEAGGAPER